MATWPPDITVELFYDGAWNDITPDVRLTANIEIELGRRNEGAAAADPGTLTLTLNNGRSRVAPAVSGRYSPKNPRSDLFGKISKGTRIRVRVDNEPAPPAPFLSDTFTRTVASGWGTADTGQAWFIQTNVNNGDPTEYFVSSGLGHLQADTISPVQLRMIQSPLVNKKVDLEATYTIRIDQRAVSTIGQTAIFAGLNCRVSNDGLTWIGALVRFQADSGLPNNAGLRVATSIVALVDGANVEAVEGTVVPDLTYAINTPLNVRLQVSGPEVRMRVWADGASEPTLWHTQAHIEAVTVAGDVGTFMQASAADTATPVTVSFDNLSVADPTPLDNAVRGVFEIYEWPPRWDISDSDVWMPVVANGLLRRLNQGSQPLQSALRRYIPSLFPVAYWPLEDTGFIGRFSLAAVAGGQSLSIAGIKFAQDSDVPGSQPLPELLESSGFQPGIGIGANPFMRCSEVPAIDNGSWSVWMLFRISADDFPTTGTHTLLQFHTSGTAGTFIVIAVGGADPALRVRVLDQNSVLITEQTATQSAAVAAGGPTITGDWRVLSVRATQSGGNVVWTFSWFPLDGSINFGGGSTFAGTVGHFRRINTTFSPSLAGMRFGHLSAWGVADPAAYFDPVSLGGQHATLGFSGEEARERARRVTVEEETLLLVQGDASTPMGSQLTSTLNDLVEEAATADIAILTEQRNESGLLLRARELMYNQVPSLVLDYASGRVFAPFEPTDDDQRIQNSITVSRARGSSVLAVQTEGPLNVNSPITDPNGVGEYAASYTVNVESDDQLPDHAGWRLHLGTVDEMRYPRVTFNLANPRMLALIDSIIALREGVKIVITNPPAWLPANDVELIVEGYKESLNAFQWELTFVCSPASPWTVGTAVELDTLLFEDFEDASLSIAVTNGGSAAWFRTQADVLFGAWSFRAGAIADNQNSDAIIEVPDQAVGFRLWYKVSSELGFDFFQILVDGILVYIDSGVKFWRQTDVIGVTGATSVTLRYVKDGAVVAGDDTVYVDNIEFLAYSSGTEESDRADTSGSELVTAVDSDDVELVVLTEQSADPFVASRVEWAGAAIPLNDNGDFEIDLSGWTGNGATLSRVPTPNGTQQFGGNWSMQITPDGVSEFPNAGSDLFPVTPGRTFTATAWLRNAATRRMSLSLNWFDSGFNFLSNDFRDQTVQADVWTFFDVQGTAPGAAAYANIAPTIPSFPTTAQIGHADEVFIRSVEPWSYPAEVPFNVRLSPNGGASGETVLVRSIEPLAWDTFTRTTASTWGLSDSGHTWSEDGGASSDRSTNGAGGVITLQASPTVVRFQSIPGEVVGACEILVDMSSSQIATGQPLTPGVLFRYASGTAYYQVLLHFGLSGAMSVSVTNVTTQIGATAGLLWVYSVNEVFRVRVRIVGQRILARIWPRDGATEPAEWHIDRTVSTGTLLNTGLLGVTCSAVSGNTNVNPAITYDNFQVVTPQRFVVDRGVNGIQRSHNSGSDIRLAQPATVAL